MRKWFRKVVVFVISVVTLPLGLLFIGLHRISHFAIGLLTRMLHRLNTWADNV